VGVLANERSAAVAVWWEALTMIRRYPVAAVVPAVLLGALGQPPYYINEGPLNLSRLCATQLFCALFTLVSLLEDQHHPVPAVSSFRSGSSLRTKGLAIAPWHL
jgi:hypothetical protein